MCEHKQRAAALCLRAAAIPGLGLAFGGADLSREHKGVVSTRLQLPVLQQLLHCCLHEARSDVQSWQTPVAQVHAAVYAHQLCSLQPEAGLCTGLGGS